MYRFTTLLFCMAFWALLPLLPPALAQEDEGETGRVEEAGKVFKMKEVVVSATKTEIDPRETGASITVITGKDIEKKGKGKVVDLLKEVPGLTVLQSGHIGGQASVYIRGAKSGNVLVLVDGVRINDPMGIGKEFDFAHLQTINIERIEIIRGPQSTLYGSDATGGVINIITKKGQGKPTFQVSAEEGSYNTFRNTFSLAGGSPKAFYSFGIARSYSEGISKSTQAPGITADPEKDGYMNTTLNSRLGFKLPLNTLLTTGFFYSNSRTDLDDGAFYDDPNYRSWAYTLSGFAELKQEPVKWWSHRLLYNYSSTLRKDHDETDPAEPAEWLKDRYLGKYQKAEWQHTFNIKDIDTVTGGIEYSRETGSSKYDSNWNATPDVFDDKSATTLSAYLHNHLKLMDRFFHIIGIRVDDHEEFGTKTSWQTSLSFIVPVIETRLKANYSTGFKAPSLYELYDSTYGNKDLKPEENYSYDFGIEQPLLNNKLILEVTYFNTLYKNMISADPMTWISENIGRVETSGIESGIKALLPMGFLAFANYTYTKTRDVEKDERLLRRPEHQASLGVNWNYHEKLNINLSLIYVGERRDGWYDESAFSTKYVNADDYYKIDLFASYWLTSYLQAFGRVENLTDEKYQAVVGYQSPGRSYYGGVKGSF